jgi:hypothetical protein
MKEPEIGKEVYSDYKIQAEKESIKAEKAILELNFVREKLRLAETGLEYINNLKDNRDSEEDTKLLETSIQQQKELVLACQEAVIRAGNYLTGAMDKINDLKLKDQIADWRATNIDEKAKPN